MITVCKRFMLTATASFALTLFLYANINGGRRGKRIEREKRH